MVLEFTFVFFLFVCLFFLSLAIVHLLSILLVYQDLLLLLPLRIWTSSWFQTEMTTGHSGHWECLQARWGDLPVRFSQQKKSCVFVVDWFPNRISRMPILSPNVLHSEASSLSCYLTVCSHDFFTVHTQWRRKRTSSLVCFPAQSLQSCLTLRPHGPQPARLFCPWDSPGKSTGVGCHFLLQW